ncbi:hypothetical protein AURDEDRAFT_161492 [Auricularia subglabra TFB-10046 SS5]|nr:hypothetical protein AURDEDRAFT_161492 [Auricularia subglabra TFB-10046 SS5]
MPAPDLTERLPEEILLKVFSLFTLAEMALLSGISRRWRAVVASHPRYFAHPKLASTSASAVAFFVARLTGTSAKSWDVAVVIHEPFPALETTVLPAIASRLDDVEILTLHVHVSHAPAVFHLLRGSSVSLRRLQLYFDDVHEGLAVTLPEDVLSHAAPGRGLQTLILHDVDLAESMPSALQSIQNLVFGHRARESCTSLHSLARAFPSARDVTLTDRVFREPMEASDWPAQWRSLNSLMLSIGRHRLRRAVRCLPLSRVAHLTTMHTREVALSGIILHLLGALEMGVQNIGWGRFVFHLTSRSSGLVRSFYEFISEWSAPSPGPHDLLIREDIMGRIQSLTIPVALWDLLHSRMITCDSVTDLTLVLSDSEDILPSPGPRFPRLRTLTLAAGNGTPVVNVGDVTKLILERLLPRSPIQLRIQGIGWTGPVQLLPAIDSVQLIDAKRL